MTAEVMTQAKGASPTSNDWVHCTGALHPSRLPCDIPIVVRSRTKDGVTRSWADHVNPTELAAEVRRLRGIVCLACDAWREPHQHHEGGVDRRPSEPRP